MAFVCGVGYYAVRVCELLDLIFDIGALVVGSYQLGSFEVKIKSG